MATRIDPEEVETKTLLAACNFEGISVLEIGCGDGRLASRYAERTSFTVGLDTDLSGLTTAHHARTAAFLNKLDFIPGRATALPFANDAFDVALFGWSL